MRDKVLLQKRDFSVDEALRLLRKGNIGGTVIFIGTVRGKGPGGNYAPLERGGVRSRSSPSLHPLPEGRGAPANSVKVPHLDYEAYGSMAVKKMDEVRRRALRDFAIEDAVIIHRVGRIRAGGRVVLLAAAAAHRDAAFRACRFMLEALKREVPIWKRELGAWTLGDGHGRRGASKMDGDGRRRKGCGGKRKGRAGRRSVRFRERRRKE